MGLRKPQGYFAFKQFTIHQEHCAMKVSTDACIQGAWLPLQRNIHRALDVGAGTGLLALMLAQRASHLNIDALEIEPAAAAQAVQNINASPFAARIEIHETDVRSFCPEALYDLIICNPPFFSQDLTGPDASRNAVRHDELLKAEDLISLAGRALEPAGQLCIMWPERRMDAWRRLMAAADFFELAALYVRNKKGARVSSVISVWSRTAAPSNKEEELNIRDDEGAYTASFIRLLNDFYLRLS